MKYINYVLAKEEVIHIEVSDEVAEFLEQSDRELKNQLRRQKAHRVLSLERLYEDWKFDVADASSDPFSLLCNELDKRAVIDYLEANLRGRQYMCMYLRCIYGYRNIDTARELGISQSAVAIYIKKALQKLRSI